MIQLHPSEFPAAEGGHGESRLRVLHVINGEHYSGAERVQDLLALRLPDEGILAGFALVKPGRFPMARVSQSAPLDALPMRGRVDLTAALRLVRIVRQRGYQLLHAHTPRTLLVARLAAAVTGLPLVYHCHSPTARDSTRAVANRINAWTEQWALGGTSHVIAVSRSLAGQLEQTGYPRQRITVVPNGVPGHSVRCTLRVPPSRTRRVRPTRGRSRPADGCWTIGTAALFRPRKGIEILLAALAELNRRGSDVRLRAVGPFESQAYERQVKELAERLGVSDRIEWTGFREDVSAELAAMDTFVLPSLFGEGMPMVVLEAMAAGVPVVASSVEGVPEVIRHGTDGLLAAPGDAGELAGCIEQLAGGRVDASALADNARRRHAAHYSDVAMARGVAQVYRRLIGAQVA